MATSSTNMTGFKPKNLRYNNYRAIINLFRDSHILSVRNISDCVGLSKTSITKIVNLLVDKGFITPIGKGNSTDEGGKKPELYILNPNYRYCITVVFDGLSCIGKFLDLNLRILHSFSLDSNYRRGYRETLDIIAKTITELLQMADLTAEKLCGIALCCPGVIDVQHGLLLEPIRDTNWGHNISLINDLKELIPFKTNLFFDNMCRYSGYYELLGSKSRSNGSYIVISTGETTGGCVIQQRQLVHGKNGLVGEFGHIKTNYTTTRKCSCGNTGCFEAMVSASALISEVLSLDYSSSSLADIISKKDLELNDIFDVANAGDSFARMLLDQIVHQFAVLISNIRFVCDPQEVIIQGIYTSAGNYFQDKLRSQIASMPFYNLSNELLVSFSSVNISDAIHSGAALYCIDKYFESNFIYN